MLLQRGHDDLTAYRNKHIFQVVSFPHLLREGYNESLPLFPL